MNLGAAAVVVIIVAAVVVVVILVVTVAAGGATTSVQRQSLPPQPLTSEDIMNAIEVVSKAVMFVIDNRHTPWL
jgi:hypothetical protein